MNEFDLKYTIDDSSCDTPVDSRTTLKMFDWLKIFNISRTSFPIRMLLPIDTFSGIFDTYISVTNPTNILEGISFISIDE